MSPVNNHRSVSAEDLETILEHLRFLGECLLVDVRWQRFGYQVDVVFDYVWDRDHRIRRDLDTRQLLVKIEMVGVESLRLAGGLSNAMRSRPDEIGWGLSEVAGVHAGSFEADAGTGVVLTVSWEGGQASQRELYIAAVGASIRIPHELDNL